MSFVLTANRQKSHNQLLTIFVSYGFIYIFLKYEQHIMAFQSVLLSF